MVFGQNTAFDLSAVRAPGTPVVGGTHVSGAGTALQLPNKPLFGGVSFFAHPSNSGTVWVGASNVGTSYATGAPLTAGGNQVFAWTSNLNNWYMNATGTADVLCWIGS